jgi:GTP cyclohydrolase II
LRMLQDIEQPQVAVPTPFGILRVRVVRVNGKELLVATSEIIPEVPVVRLQSSCVFGEAFHAVDCDCGAQLTAALKLIGDQGGVLVYAWEEGRGAGIADKLKAIAMQQTNGLSTSDAFRALGHEPDPRTFDAHVEALRTVVTGGAIRLASGNPKKIRALEAAGYTVERIKLEVEMTPEREAYVRHKRDYLGHIHDD